jgi:hypothetical protein
MKTIKFSDAELVFLRQQYTDELAHVEKYLVQVKEVLKKLGGPSNPIKTADSIEQEPKIIKRRGRKTKVKALESDVPGKRGPNPEVKAVESKIPKKRGRPSKLAVLPKEESSTVPFANEPIKRGRKTGSTVKSASGLESLPVKAIKKPAKKRFFKKRRSRRINLVSLRKPLRIKPPVVEREEEPVSGSEPENQPENPIPPYTE